jgi:hypothetical protein
VAVVAEPQKGEGRVRKQFLGRHIMLKGEFADKLLTGRKKTTIRIGIVKPKYREVIIHGKGKPLAKAIITNVTYKKVSELTDEDAMRDGFSNVSELLSALRKVYGDVKPDDIVTIIELEVTQRLDMLPPEDPYLGLEPADIARLALRYIRGLLTEEDVKVLEDLARTNSIRATAIRLYGSIEERWRVRKSLRKALRILREKGLLRVWGNRR